MSFRCCKNDRGVSATTWSTRIRVCITVSTYCHSRRKGTFKYSTNRFKNATKCSAFRIFPGIASFNRSSGNTEPIRLCDTKLRWTYMDYPWSRRYHYHYLTSTLADLRRAWHIHLVTWQHRLFWPYMSWKNAPMTTLKKTCSSILSDSLTTLRPAASSIGLVRSMLNDSMQTLSTSARCQ